MKRLISIVLFILILSSCEKSEHRSVPLKTESKKYSTFDKICLDGVYYWQGNKRMSVAFNQDSTVQKCDEKQVIVEVW